MTKAIRFYETGGPEVLQLESVAVGDPGPGQARVRHSYIALNFIDVYFRTGRYPLALPNGLGSDAVGVVEAVGPGEFQLYQGRPPGRGVDGKRHAAAKMPFAQLSWKRQLSTFLGSPPFFPHALVHFGGAAGS